MKSKRPKAKSKKRVRAQSRRSLERVVSSRLISCVPTTWLDDLLSGPKKVVCNEAGGWGCPDIERLLNAVRERMVKATN